MEFGRHS